MERQFPRSESSDEDDVHPRKKAKSFNKTPPLLPADVNVGTSTSIQPMPSLLTIKFDNLRSNLDKEEEYFTVLFSCPNVFLKYMAIVGVIRIRHFCSYCGYPMTITQTYWRNEIWCCTSGNRRCLAFRLDENFRFRINAPMIFITNSLYMWYRNRKPNAIIQRSMITPEDYRILNNVLTEVCIRKCMRGSKKIGGFKVRINVEVGRRGGIMIPNYPIICGVNPDDDNQYFLIVMGEEYPKEAEVRYRLKNHLLPGTIVYTTSTKHKISSYMNWIPSSDWPLITNSGNIPRDLWMHTNHNLPNIFRNFLIDTVEIVRLFNF